MRRVITICLSALIGPTAPASAAEPAQSWDLHGVMTAELIHRQLLVQTQPGHTLLWEPRGWLRLGARDADPDRLGGTPIQGIAPEMIASVEPALRVSPANPRLAAEIGLDRYSIVHLAPGVDVEQAASRLREHASAIRSVTRPSPAMVHASAMSAPGVDDGPGVEPQPTDPRIPNDTSFKDQYALRNRGQSVEGQVGTPGADIHVLDAWTYELDLDAVTVAVIDSGVSRSHPDLEGSLLTGANMFCPPQNPCFDQSDDDTSSHGTHVAGIIGATKNNEFGIAGIASGVKILPVKVLNALGFGTPEITGNGILWATDQGADVISISIGHPSPNGFLEDAVEYAYQSGVVICASSGNLPTQPVAYPAAYDRTIAVGATDNNDMPASFTSTGPELTLVAPGVEICSTWDSYSGPGENTVHFLSGTSQACPQVAGVAALILAKRPTLSPDAVREALINTATDLGDPGWDPQYAHGRLNASAALLYAACPLDIAGSAGPGPDGVVDHNDLALYLSLYLEQDPRADIASDRGVLSNGDGFVDQSDFGTFVDQFDSGCNPPEFVPN